MIKRLIAQGREMERQIAARDGALFAGVDAQLEQHFLTPGQRLSPPGVGNVMLLMVCLTLGLAGVMGLATDVAAAWSGDFRRRSRQRRDRGGVDDVDPVPTGAG
ncbi:hypothetical protein NFX37_26825 [Serratia marcescens]|nr:hypothetical protein NFX37_26825 [Serratia marcescens]